MNKFELCSPPEVPFPMRIDHAEYEDPILMLGGDGWSLSVMCLWRWVASDCRIATGESAEAADLVWDLVGDEIIAVNWIGPPMLGVDPRFELRSGGTLDILSDATFDTWVMHLPGLTLVGPLTE